MSSVQYGGEISDLFTPTGDAGISGGDALSKNANRAFAWFIAGIVASVIVSLLLLIVTMVFGLTPDMSNGFKLNTNNAAIAVAGLLSLGIGFAVGGAVYESWVGCPGTA